MLGRALSLITAIVMALCCACAVVGTAGSQYSNTVTVLGVETKTWVYLYASQTRVEDDDRETTYYDRDDFDCKSLYDKLTAAFALGLAGIAFSFAAALAAFLSLCCRVVRFSVTFLSLLAFLCLVPAFALSVSIYTMSQCDADSLKDQDYDINWGLIILIISAGIALIGTLLSLAFLRPEHHHHDHRVSKV